MEDAIKKLKESPYEQFKEGSGQGYENLKNEKQQREKKVRKYITKIKVNQLNESGTEGNSELSSKADSVRLENIEAKKS